MYTTSIGYNDWTFSVDVLNASYACIHCRFTFIPSKIYIYTEYRNKKPLISISNKQPFSFNTFEAMLYFQTGISN